METAVKSPALLMRIFKLAWIVSAFLFVYIVVTIPADGHHSVSPVFELAITVVAFLCVVVGFNTRRFFFGAGRRASENEPQSIQLKRWMTTNVMSLAYFEACILFGLVLHFLGARVRFVELLFVVGILSMIFWSPGTPPTTEEGRSSQG